MKDLRETRRELHIAALPFPTHQGTQAAILSMLRASQSSGVETHLLSYAHGAYQLDESFVQHRLRDLPRVRSLRSGPSLGKILLDAQLISLMRNLEREIQPDIVIAHHIEAALGTALSGVQKWVYFKHTDIEQELPVYAPKILAPALTKAAAFTDAWLCHRADAIALIAPSLKTTQNRPAHFVPTPWTIKGGSDREQKARARHVLGIAQEAELILYAGNLDAYQGWEDILDAALLLKESRPRLRLLFASESALQSLKHEVKRRDLDSNVLFSRLGTEASRTRVHAAADLAIIPRRTPGGLPIKLLEAFSRAVPAIVTQRASAGLALEDACLIADNDSPEALAKAICSLLDDERSRHDLVHHALDYLRAHHSNAAFISAMRQVSAKLD